MNHQRTYGALLHLYPSSFRREWSDEMVQAFGDQIVRPVRPTRHPVARAWLATVRDLATSVPRQRMEHAMSPSTPLGQRFTTTLPFIGVIAVGALVGSRVIVLPFVLIGLTVLALRRRNRVAKVFGQGLRWYELIGLGFGILAAIAIGAASIPDMDGVVEDALWWLAFTSFLLGWALMIIGAVTGLAAGWRRVRPRPAA